MRRKAIQSIIKESIVNKNRGVASANFVTTDFNPLKRAANNKRTVGSAHILSVALFDIQQQ